MSDPLLSVSGLTTHFDADGGTVRAVDGVDFDVESGETVCLVGESGSGKTVTCETLTKLLPMPPGEIVAGEAVFDGTDLTKLSEKELQSYRGDRIAHVFQNPGSALDPVYSVGDHIAEALRYHRDIEKSEARERAIELLDRVGIPNAPARVDEYPHEFSGGMRQRVVIALALANDPDLLVADEPTTALDVTIEAQILDLLADVQEERDMAVLYVTHDLGVVAELADRVVVMYAGKVMEQGPVEDIFRRPTHPYTQALLESMPGRGERRVIEGSLPDPTDPPDGCRFHPRCPHAVEECAQGDQPAMQERAAQQVSCIYYDESTRLDPATVRDAHGASTAEADGGRPVTGAPTGGTGDSGESGVSEESGGSEGAGVSEKGGGRR